MFNGRVLILSPHMDDEVLGCGGLMSQIAPERLIVLYCSNEHPQLGGVIETECRTIEKTLGHNISIANRPVNQFHRYPIDDWIHSFEQIFKSDKPDTLLIPYPDYNQDHRVVFEAAITASRVHDQNHYIKNVLAYESPCTQQTNRLNGGFVPHVFLPIDIDRKLELYQLYESQVRAHRSPDYVRHLAGVRGMQCGKLYAEAFMVVRITA